MSDRVGEVIATRTVADGGHPVLIEMGRPTQPVDGMGTTGFRIAGLGEFTATGVDGMAALYNALVEVGTILARANDKGHRFTVLDPSTMGFPVAPSRPRVAEPAAQPPRAEVIALRILITEGGPCAVEIGRPTRAPGQSYYICRFRIDGKREAVASGVDEIQALLTALRMIGAWLMLPTDWPLSRAS
ncbi:DUF6968 family protein [Nocardia goodfellowii]|uniref:DUF6968 domain-containing protein n=1 Tax=Nocardia goodfellowii TaxID=882446 RepID=A0ABS4QIA5_9NOCA|nr:hypothetical protein [Nocardia goodfellowii]MBP2191447.1 hypothetical protein [Nocardia goodfellowii]